MNESSFSEFSAQDSHLAALEAQEWIEAVVGKKFLRASFRESLEDGVLLCELMNKVSPGSIRRINKSKSPIAYLDNIQQFLNRCQDLGLNDAQLFDSMDLQEIKTAKKGVKRNEADRRIRTVCITLFWLGRSVAELDGYSGPQLDLNLFKKLMEGKFSEPEGGNEESKQLNHLHEHEHQPRTRSPPTSEEDPQIESPITNGNLDNDLALTFEQEQTADELLADIQNAVDEMLKDFQTSAVSVNPPPVVAPKHAKHDKPQTKPKPPTAQHSIHLNSKNGGFGFQIMGGVDSELQAQVDYIVPGSPADHSGLLLGDTMVHVNGQNIQHLSHVDLVSVIKKAGQVGEVNLGVNRTPSNSESAGHTLSSHALTTDSNEEDLVGFSRRESRDKWDEENEERERQAQEIALLYPHRSSASHSIENGLGLGPPTTFGTVPLTPLVEHQEEAMFEQIQEMMDSASPPPSPPSSPAAPPSFPSSSSQNSSHPTTPNTISPNQLHDDKESIEREIQELALMEAAKPMVDDSLSFSDEEELADNRTRYEANEQPFEAPIEIENDNSIAVKYDTFSVEESTSPLPLSPITELSPDAELSPPVSPHPAAEDIDAMENELNELLKYSLDVPQLTTPPPEEGSTPSDIIVTPPPMFESPPPPKPKSVAPKRIVKRPAPPPPKPKPKVAATPTKPDPVATPTKPDPVATPTKPDPVATPTKPDPVATPAKPDTVAMVTEPDLRTTPDLVTTPTKPIATPTEFKLLAKPTKSKPIATPTEPEPVTKPTKSLEEEDITTPAVNGIELSSLPDDLLSDSLFQRSQSPDLVTQMQELAYSKSIAHRASWELPQQPEHWSSASKITSSPPQEQQEMKTSSLPRNIHTAVLQSPYHSPPQNLALSSGLTAAEASNTPKLVEVLGNIKIQRVMKQRWTPKSSSTDPSPVHTPDQATMPASYRSATLPNKNYQQNGYGHNPGGRGLGISSVVAAKGIGAGIGRGQNKFQPIPVKGNPYQNKSLQQQQQSQPWRSQEELSGHNHQKTNAARLRQASTPDGMRDHRVKKSMSMPRGNMDVNSRANTWGTSKAAAPSQDGYSIAYSVHSSNPHDLCSRCHQPLGQGTVLSMPSLKTVYHAKCFICRVCREPLAHGGQSTTITIKNRQPHCRFCISGENGTQTTEC